jgi:hypothetical protein
VREFPFRYESAEHFVEIFRTFYGPVHKAFAALDASGQAASRPTCSRCSSAARDRLRGTRRAGEYLRRSSRGDRRALRLMCVLAHPDDESLGTGGTLAKYAAEGVETYVLTATRGERGRFLEGVDASDPEVVGATREAELHAAVKELGVHEYTLLRYPDGGLDAVDPARRTA